MSVAVQVLEEFGESLGISGLELPSSGAVRLEFEKRGVLWFETFDETLMVSLVRELGPGDEPATTLRRALAACHYREGLPYDVQPGLRGDSGLVFVVRLPLSEITLPALERVLDLLTRVHDSVRS